MPVLFEGVPDVSLLACAAWLNDHSMERRIRLECVVSDAWARYAVVPWSANIRRERERDSLARIVLEPLTSPMADGWSVICGGQAARRAPMLACALPDSLLGLLEGLAGRRIHLATTTPLFMQVFNRLRRTLPTSVVLAFRGWDQFTIAVIDEGRWKSVRAHRLPATADEALRLMMRAVTVHGLERACPLAYADLGGERLDMEGVDMRTWHPLPDLSDLSWPRDPATSRDVSEAAHEGA